MLTIKSVQKGGVGEELGLRAGDKLVSFDGGLPVADMIDYLYLDSLESMVLTVETKEGEAEELDIEKYGDEPLGLEFCEKFDTRTCKNNCIFCFIDQLPKGMRRSLYLKDDDWRWSVVSGNYVTLTNMSDADIKRIVRYGISPLYISVHTVDAALRAKMLGRADAEILDKLRSLHEAGIVLHAQIVAVPGINDGEKLAESIDALRGLVDSLAVVPVGLTRHRRIPLPSFDAATARAVIDLTEAGAKTANYRGEKNWVTASDEFYIRAGRPLPAFEAYGEFPQIENGVGLVAKLEREFETALDQVRADGSEKAKTDIVTGEDSFAFISGLVARAKQKFPHIECAVHRIENTFFGSSVTVSGLIVGGDIQAQLAGKLQTKILGIPSVMLRDGGDCFLDDTTVDGLSASLGVKVTPVSPLGESLLSFLTGRALE